MRNEQKTRRVRLAYISADDILHAFGGSPQNWDMDFVTWRSFKDLPDDATVISVNYDYMRQSFGFLIEHESFALVGLCEIPPTMDLEVIAIPVEKPGAFAHLLTEAL